MKLYGVPAADLRAIVEEVSDSLYDGNLTFNNFDARRNYVLFTLRVNSSKGKGARRSGRGNRTVAACWHAHKHVMEAIFARFPDARLVSALATYNGAGDFHHKHGMTRYHNCGSMMQPAEFGDCCECHEVASLFA